MERINEDFVTELFVDNKKICRILLKNNIYTIKQLKQSKRYNLGLNFPKIEFIEKRLKEYKARKFIIKKYMINNNLKDIYINELKLPNYINRKLIVNSIDTFEDIHYIISKNLIDFITDFSLKHKKILLEKYYSVLSGKIIIKRLLSDDEINIANKNHYVDISILDVPSKIITCCKLSNIDTIGDLKESILKAVHLRYLEQKNYSLLLKAFKDCLVKLDRKEFNKKLIIVNKR